MDSSILEWQLFILIEIVTYSIHVLTFSDCRAQSALQYESLWKCLLSQHGISHKIMSDQETHLIGGVWDHLLYLIHHHPEAFPVRTLSCPSVDITEVPGLWGCFAILQHVAFIKLGDVLLYCVLQRKNIWVC